MQAVGMLWLARVATPDVAFVDLVVPFILAGAGISMAMPAAQNAVVSSVAPTEIGKAAGTYNMLRFLGGALGVAINATVFAAYGGFGSPHSFSTGFSAAIGVSAVFSLAGALAGAFVPAANIPRPMQSDLVWTADRDAFQQLAEPYRRQLLVHCYRMLGSLHEAEDLVQETFLRAWRSRQRFEGRASFRNWLYRIATNACLNAIAARPSAGRITPEMYGPPADRFPSGKLPTEIAWLEPYPDSELDAIADAALGPDARYELQESVQLAFVAAIQQLPARQRAVLLLRDVLGWSAAETAELLDASVASVNSALQRARATLETRYPTGEPSRTHPTDENQRDLLERYVRAWEAKDIDSLVALLREDAVLSMPPWPHWYRGREAIRSFFAWAWRLRTDSALRMVPVGANRQPAFVYYFGDPGSVEFVAHGIMVVTVRDGAVAAMAVFRDSGLLAGFGVPDRIPV